MVNRRIPQRRRFGRTQAFQAETEHKIKDLERVDGAQFGRILEKVKRIFQDIVDLTTGLADQVAAYIGVYSYTRAQIDAKTWPAGSITSGILAPARGGSGTANVYSTTSTGTQLQVFVRPDGQLTVGASSERFKTDIDAPAVDLTAILHLFPREFRWRSEIADAEADAQIQEYALQRLADDGGDESPCHVEPVTPPLDYGLIAEEAEALGLDWLVRYGPDGATPDGVRYDRLPIALLAVVQQQQAQIDAQDARITALENILRKDS